MCRILGYLGPRISLDQLISKPEHSLLVQSYQPREMKSAILNGDGFGLGWYDSEIPAAPPFIYRNPLPMWNDQNLSDLCRYVRSPSWLANLRSATDKMPAEMSNCQPFFHGQLLFIHNGLIENFYKSLYRPIREQLCDVAYNSIQGRTDSEHIFALLVHHLETQPGIDLAEALAQTIEQIEKMARKAAVHVSANIILSMGDRLVALRFDNQQTAPSFYLLKDSKRFPSSIILASEPLFEDDWQPYPQSELISIRSDLKIDVYPTVA
ncbi:MAG: ergothioneine biosynthesis protein EgtC [Phormidesmis sp.]